VSGKKASRTSPKTPVLASPMRPDASQTEDPDIATHKICECGCGRKFIPAKKHHIYFSDRCRRNAWINKNAAAIAVSQLRKENAAIRVRLARIEAKIGIGGQS